MAETISEVRIQGETFRVGEKYKGELIARILWTSIESEQAYVPGFQMVNLDGKTFYVNEGVPFTCDLVDVVPHHISDKKHEDINKYYLNEVLIRMKK